jgi:HSF-type DNA-binding
MFPISSHIPVMFPRQAHNNIRKRFEMCVSNNVNGRAHPALFRQDEIYHIPSSTWLNECAPQSASVRPSQPGDKVLIAKGCSAKACSRRRFHALRPGKTAKHHERQFVVHDYHDHSQDEDDNVTNDRWCVSTLFPLKLHEVLEEVARDGLDYIVSWAPHGRCFTVHMPKEFVDQILPR